VKQAFREIGSSVYAWDLHDEETEQVLDNLQNLAGVNSVYLIALMHKERHPWPNTDDFPHNPIRREYITEDSRAYWQCNASRYGRVTPSMPTNFLAGTDWLETLTTSARRRGMKVGVELSHTLLGSDRLAEEYPDLRQIDIYGQPLRITHIGDDHFVPCMNNQDFQEYVVNLYQELIGGYDIDYILNCMIPYPLPAQYLLTEYEDSMHPLDWMIAAPVGSGCFCPACHEKAAKLGFDLDKIRDELLYFYENTKRIDPRQTNQTVLGLLLENSAFWKWIHFKCASVTEYYRLLGKTAHKAKSNIDHRLNLYITSHPEYAGLDCASLAPHFDSVRVCCYIENLGRPELMAHKHRVLCAAKRAFGEKKHLLSAIGVLSGATPETVQAGIAVSANCGINSIALGHYDGASFDMLRAVKASVFV
jgi:hypothetical protein